MKRSLDRLLKFRHLRMVEALVRFQSLTRAAAHLGLTQPALTKAIREVARGGTYFSPAIAKRLARNPSQPLDREGQPKANASRLTSREAEVLQLVAEGSANKQVAATLGISIKTVEKHRENLMLKLNIHETAGLTRYAIEAGIIESSVQLTIL